MGTERAMLGISSCACFCGGVAVDVLVRDVTSDSRLGRGVAGQVIISGTRSMLPIIGEDVTIDPVDLTVTLFSAEIPSFVDSRGSRQELYNVTKRHVFKICIIVDAWYKNPECAPTIISSLSY